MLTRSSTVCAVLCVLAFASIAGAQDTWRRPHRAMRHIHRRVGTLDWHLVTVDLRAPGVRFVGTPESMLESREPGRGHVWRTTSDFARQTGADVAINANYYDIYNRAFTTCGLTASAGHVWTSTYVDRRLECWWSMGFGSRGRVEVFDSHGKTFGPVARPWMTEVVTGSPHVLENGVVLSYTSPRHALVRNPRTLIGTSADRRTLFLMVVNGREGANKGMTCPEAARILRDFGASDAVNLDGGGSSAMFVRSEGGLVSHPADGVERAVGNHFGVILDGPAEVAPDPDDEGPKEPAAPLRAAVARPTTTPRHAVALRARSNARAAASANTARETVVRAGCQGAPGMASPEAAWGALVLAVLVALLRRSPHDRA